MTLSLSGGSWTVLERRSHPANAMKVSKLLSGISSLKCARALDDASDSELADLGLGTSRPAMELKLLDSKGVPLASLILGRPHMKADSSAGDDPDGR